jgi:hypothetical protein
MSNGGKFKLYTVVNGLRDAIKVYLKNSVYSVTSNKFIEVNRHYWLFSGCHPSLIRSSKMRAWKIITDK